MLDEDDLKPDEAIEEAPEETPLDEPIKPVRVEPETEVTQKKKKETKPAILQPKGKSPIPLVVHGQRLRLGEDGIYFLVRKHRKAIAYLDERMDRVGPLQWMLKIDDSRNIENLRSALAAKPLYIVGKGPSLDEASKQDFSDHPDSAIICINESITKIESLNLPNPVIALQVDRKLGVLPCKAKRITSTDAAMIYKDSLQVHHTKYGRLSVEVAMGIGHELGVTEFLLFAFDASKSQKLGYADCIGKDPMEGGDPNRFYLHKVRIERAAGKKPLKYI